MDLRDEIIFRPTDGDSRHGLAVYPNLARNLVWVSDISYIRLEREFVYLAIILDAFSRRVIAWTVDVSLDADLTLAALQMARPEERRPGPRLVHHSDCCRHAR